MQRGIANYENFRNFPSWRRSSAGVAVAASVVLLVLGLLLPERHAAPLIALGLAGILSVRLFAVGAVRRLAVGHETDAPSPAAAGPAGEERVDSARPASAVSQRWHPAIMDDVLDDSFPASDPPSWSAFRAGPPPGRPRPAGAAA